MPPARPSRPLMPAPEEVGAPVSPEVAQVFSSLRRLVHAMHTASREAEQHLGLTGAQLFVLTLLRTSPSLSINALAERTMTHQSTVSVVVQRLVRRKLVRKVRSSVDARRVELTLTRAGMKLLEEAPEAIQTRVARAIESLPSHSRIALGETLGQLVTSLGIDDAPEVMLFEDHGDGEG